MNSGPIFRRSTFRNEDILILEPPNYLPQIRILMIIMCILMGVGTFLFLMINYMKYRQMLQNTILHRIVVPALLILNILFHVAHYSHNIYDPAAYFEPKKLYIKRFITEMEPTFLFNFPLSILFMISSRTLLISCTTSQFRNLSMPVMVTFYSLMSMISGAHYTYEPPTNFSITCNMTIAGEATVAFLLLVVAWLIYQLNLKSFIGQKYSRLSTNLKHKLSDNTSSEDELS